NRSIELSTTEYELLALFLRNPRVVLTRNVLMDRIGGHDFEGGPDILEVYIGHLRNKLEQNGEKRLIQTVRGAGYVLRTAESALAAMYIPLQLRLTLFYTFILRLGLWFFGHTVYA